MILGETRLKTVRIPMPHSRSDTSNTPLACHHRILLTGAAGGLGRALRRRLASNCAVLRLSDIAPPPADLAPHEEWHTVDLADRAAVLHMAADVGAIVHMGGVSVERPFDEILPANIVGVYNLYEAARKQGVKRVLFASSNHVTGFYKQSETIDAAAPPRPDGMYGISKAFGEDLSRFYFDRHGIETACLRIGSSFPEPKDRRMLASWLSYDDLHRLITACLSTPVLGHSTVFGMSNNAVTWWDNRLAQHVGFVAQDSSDAFRSAVYARTAAPDVNDPAVIYQGGAFVTVPPFE
jgi:uronate dehydrogenase